MNHAVHFTSARTGEAVRDRWETPPDVFQKLYTEFCFVLDAAASQENALCDDFITLEMDALSCDWTYFTERYMGAVWVNPPYSKLKAFLKKAREEADRGATVVLLIPARTDTIAWHAYVQNSGAEVRFIKGRLRFRLNGHAQKQGAPFPSAVVIMRPTDELQPLRFLGMEVTP